MSCYPLIRSGVGEVNGEGTVYFVAGNNNITSNPAMASMPANAPAWPAAPNFMPNAGSPLIDAGYNVSGAGLTADLLGRPRPQGPAYDIGPYEAVQGNAVAVAPAKVKGLRWR